MKGKPREQGQPMNQTTYQDLGDLKPGLSVKVHVRGHLRAGPVCVQKNERNEMTGHEGGEDMKGKRQRSVCVPLVVTGILLNCFHLLQQGAVAHS